MCNLDVNSSCIWDLRLQLPESMTSLFKLILWLAFSNLTGHLLWLLDWMPLPLEFWFACVCVHVHPSCWKFGIQVHLSLNVMCSLAFPPILCVVPLRTHFHNSCLLLAFMFNTVLLRSASVYLFCFGTCLLGEHLCFLVTSIWKMAKGFFSTS